MENIIRFATADHQNNYLYNREKSCFVYVHPVMKYLIGLSKEGKVVEEMSIEELSAGIPQFSSEEVEYYKKKYVHWKERGLYNSQKYEYNYACKINPEDIKKQLANIEQVVFEVTDNCNLKCYYCGYGQLYNFYDKRDCVDLKKEKAFLLIDYLADLWRSSYYTSFDKEVYMSFYGGEPLMNVPLIQEIIDYLEEKKLSHVKFVYSMTTNAIYLKKYIDFLVKYDFHLLVSLDGDRSNNSYRLFKNKQESFDIVYDNVKYVKEVYPDYFRERVSFNAVLHNRNSVSDIYCFIQKEFDKMPSIGELNSMGVREDQKEEFYKTYQNTIESLHQQEDYSVIEKNMFVMLPDARNLVFFIHRYVGNVFSSYNDFFINKRQIPVLPTGTCFPFNRKLFITTAGKILPCERIPHKYSVGMITDTDVLMDFESIANQYNSYYLKLEKQCKNCYRGDGCGQCLFYLKDLDETPRCPGFADIRKLEAYLGSFIYHLENQPEEYGRIVKEIALI